MIKQDIVEEEKEISRQRDRLTEIRQQSQTSETIKASLAEEREAVAAKVAELAARQEASAAAAAEVEENIQKAQIGLRDNETESDSLAEMLRLDQAALDILTEQAAKQDTDIKHQKTMLAELQKRRAEVSDKNAKQAEESEKLRKEIIAQRENLAQQGRSSPAGGNCIIR